MTKNVAVCGLVAGAAGVALMTLAEKCEQHFTGRPNSYVPARTLKRLLGKKTNARENSDTWNLVMHWGQGIVLGPVRAYMSRKGLRGPSRSFIF